MTLLALLTATALAQSSGPSAVLVQANQAYERSDYAAAISGYEALVAEGHDTSGVLYNLGNARLRDGDLAGAIAAYRTAQIQAPRDEDLRANLAFARTKVVDAVPPPAPSAVASTLLFWHNRLSPRELAHAALVFNLLFWLALAARRLWPTADVARYATFAAAPPWLALTGSLLAHSLWPAQLGVIRVAKAPVYAGTSTDAVVRFELHEGTEAWIRDDRDAWTRIELSNGSDGWLPSDHVQRIPVRIEPTEGSPQK